MGRPPVTTGPRRCRACGSYLHFEDGRYWVCRRLYCRLFARTQ